MLKKIPVAIVGMGGIFPGADHIEKFRQNIISKRNMVRTVTEGRWIADPAMMYHPKPLPDKAYSLKACFVDDFILDLNGLDLDDTLVSRLDPLYHFVLHAGRDAFFDSRTEFLDKNRINVILAAIALPTDSSSKLTRKILGKAFESCLLGKTAPETVTPEEYLTAKVTGFPASLLAKALGLGGGSYTLDAACASSLYAVKLACEELQAFRADAVLAGGVSRPECLYTQVGFSQLRALSPSGKCAPFDKDADGLVVGEGAGIIMLKRLDDAIVQKDRIYAVIHGIGLSNDMSANLLAPDSEGQIRAMKTAYKIAGWSPSDVDMIECHGAGTRVGDAVELASLKALWESTKSKNLRTCAIGSIKSNIGHLLTAAGAAGLIKTVLGLHHKVLPPSANFKEAPESSPLRDGLFRVQTEACPWERRNTVTPRRAAVSAFGFGGINAHLLVQEYDEALYQISARDINTIFSNPHPDLFAGERIEDNSIPKEKRFHAPRVAVVGMAVCLGSCTTLRQFREMIFKGDTIIRKRPEHRWKGADEYATQLVKFHNLDGGFLHYVEMGSGDFRIPPNEIASILPQQLLMLKVSADALKDAGFPLREKRPSMGTIIGINFDYEASNFHLRWNLSNQIEKLKNTAASFSGIEENNEWLESLKNIIGPPLNAVRTQGALGGIVASRIAKEFGFGGPGFTVSQEEASGVRALEIGVRALQRYEMDSALVGAVDLSGDIRNVIIHHQLKPWTNAGEVFSFDHRAGGALPGEGASALVLKRLDDALADGNRIYAVIDGLGSSSKSDSDNTNVSAYIRSMGASFSDAGIDPVSVSYLEAMGAGNLSDDTTEAEAISIYFKKRAHYDACALGALIPNIGNTGAVCGLAGIIKTCLCLYHELIPPLRNFQKPSDSLSNSDTFHIPTHGQYWARDRKDGPRRACAGTMTVDDNFMHVVLESVEPSKIVAIEQKRPAGLKENGLFCVTADDKNLLLQRLRELEKFVLKKEPNSLDSFEYKACRWFQTYGTDAKHPCAVAIIAQNASELKQSIQETQNSVQNNLKKEFNSRNRTAFNPEPLGPSASIAFVFPGSGNHFLGMGREIGLQWPDLYHQLDLNTEKFKTQLIPHIYMPWRTSWEPGWEDNAMVRMESDVLHMIFGQVVHGGVMASLMRSFGVEPSSVIGYSLGESAGLFAMGAWPDRGEMLYRMQHTDLFSQQLAGPCKAARKAWKLSMDEPFEWLVAVLNRPADMVRHALNSVSHVRLLIVNTPDECVIGGKKEAVEEIIRNLGCEAFFLKGVVTVHCDAAFPAAEAYKRLHLFPTTVLENVRFYSCSSGCAYDISPEKAAESITKQALTGFDFTRTIHKAYQDGVRIFLEMGPHASCTRMIRTILKDQPHLAISASVRSEDEHLTVLKSIGSLVAERIPVDLEKLYGPDAVPVDLNMASFASTKNTVRVPVGGPPPCFDVSAIKTNNTNDEKLAELKNPVTLPSNLPPDANMLLQANFADMIKELTRSNEATAEAHCRFLDFSMESGRAYMEAFGIQNRLLESLLQEGMLENKSPSALDSEEILSFSHQYQPPVSENTPALSTHQVSSSMPAYSRDMCMEFAVGSLSRVLGPEFAEVDCNRVRVRLPDEPLMLVDRILTVEGEKGSLTFGRVVTEHDVIEGAWYLDGGRAPVCIAVEAGQADLFLCSYLGIDLYVKGSRTYRLLDAVVEFRRGLPLPGDTIRYDIKIEKFVRQGETYLFFFHFNGFIGTEHLITMTEGCAGFFTEAEIQNSGGIILTKEETRFIPGKVPEDYIPLTSFPHGPESYNERQLDALRNGNLAGCFGSQFDRLSISESLVLPGGRMKLIHRILELDPEGGRYGIGSVRAEADIAPDDWFLTCHFMDDMVMPGTLMYECCAHTLRVLLQRMGWVTDKPAACYEPVVGVRSRLKCRGPVTPKTRHVIYEVSLKEIGFFPEPFVIADALMYADGRPIVSFKDMSLKMTGVTKNDIEQSWKPKAPDHIQTQYDRKQTIYDRDKILAFAVGKPSEAFGKPYRVFDEERKIARLPGPPYSFMDRVVQVEPQPWVLKPGGWIEAEYDFPPDAWYFSANRTLSIPFCVLLEIALQPCGWLAAYAGSALKSGNDLKFRNLGGRATLIEELFPEHGPLVMKSRMTKVSEAADMIIEYFDFMVLQNNRIMYEGDTYFGFFTGEALKQQVGIRGAEKICYLPTEKELKRAISENLPMDAPYSPDDPETSPGPLLSLPSKALLMIDQIDIFIPEGGTHGLGFVRGAKKVNPDEWFFKAHFFQDPVCPGSLGIESFLQLLKFFAIKKWPHFGNSHRFQTFTGKNHIWTYRGQIIPTNKLVHVEAVITGIQEEPFPVITADGCLKVDGLVIYQMKDFGIRLSGGL